MALVIRGGTVVNADRSFRADVVVDGGRIVAVGEGVEAPTAAEVVDAGGAYVIPGGIDPHTHMEMPFMGTVTVEDFESGTASALAGGTTMIVDMCIPSPQQSLVDGLEQWMGWAEKSVADYGFHVAITWWSERVAQQMAEIVDRGVNSFKHFMAYKGALMVDDEIMFQSFSQCRELGALPLVHAENGEAVFRLQQMLLARGITGPEGHALSRPPHVEAEAATRAIMLAKITGVPLYIVHTSCKETMDAIARARAEGQRVYGEPLAQYLCLDESVYRSPDWDFAASRVMSPPFRSKEHQDALWAGLMNGTLQVTATDHCTFLIEQKRMGRDNFTKIPNGTGGIEERLKILWHFGVNQGRITPNEFVAVTSANCAKIFNVYPQKGCIVEGADADIVVWDPKAHHRISQKTHHSKLDVNVFEGIEVEGAPAVTISRGQVVWRQGKLDVARGRGRFVPRPPHAPEFEAQAKWNEVTAPHAVKREVSVVQTP